MAKVLRVQPARTARARAMAGNWQCDVTGVGTKRKAARHHGGGDCGGELPCLDNELATRCIAARIHRACCCPTAARAGAIFVCHLRDGDVNPPHPLDDRPFHPQRGRVRARAPGACHRSRRGCPPVPGLAPAPAVRQRALAERLAGDGLDYAWLSRLGGRRRGEAAPEHLGWRNPSFRSYAAYTWTEEFAEGLEELLHIAEGRRTAFMCSELLWWRCHRALISDVLRLLGMQVIHILGEAPGTPHPYTSPARIVDGELTYPAEDCC